MTTIQDGRIRYIGVFQDPNDLGMLIFRLLSHSLFLRLKVIKVN